MKSRAGIAVSALLLYASPLLHAQSVDVGSGSTEEVRAGARVEFLAPSGASVAVKTGARLVLSGGDGNPGILAGPATGLPISIEGGGSFDSRFARFENISGMTVTTGGKILRLKDSVFEDSASSTIGVAAWLDLSALTSTDAASTAFSFNRVTFSDLKATPNRKNIKTGASTPIVRVLGNSAHGNRWGSAQEDDPADRVFWHTGAVTRGSDSASFDTLEDALKSAASTASDTFTVTLGPDAFIDDLIDWNARGSFYTTPTVKGANLGSLVTLSAADGDGDTTRRGKLINCVVARGGIEEIFPENCTLFDSSAAVITVNNVTGTNLLIENGYSFTLASTLTTSLTSVTASYFIGAADYNFRLSSPGGSAAIDEGTTLTETLDFEGDTRGFDGKVGGSGTWDIGADEFVFLQAPPNFRGTALTPGSIRWAWDNVLLETGYVVHDAAHVEKGTVGADVLEFTESSGLTENAAYTRHAHAVNALGSSDASATATVYTLVHEPITGDFTASPTSAYEVLVSVTAPPNSTADSTACEVSRSSTGTGGWIVIKAFATSGYSVTDSGLLPNTTYYYRIRFQNGDAVATGYSPNNTATTLPPPAPPNFRGTALTTASILWEWDDVLGETGYSVHDDAHAVKGTTGADVLQFTESTGLVENTAYSRHAHSVSGAVAGPASATVVRYTRVHDPAAGELSLSAPAHNQVDVTVTPPPNASAGSTACEIERSPDGLSGWSVVKAFGVAGYSFMDNTVAGATIYFYRFRYRNGDAVVTAFSAALSIKTPPEPPSGLRVTVYATAVDIEWNPSTSPASQVAGYNIYRKLASDPTWPTTPLNTTGVILNTKYRDEPLVTGTTYQYRVTAVGN